MSYTAGMADGTAPREVVEAGYDVVADDYAALECAGHEWPRLRWLRDMLARVTPGARVLDVGCGNGIPATREIAGQYKAIGIDISSAQIERATRNVPTAAFKRADLMEVEFTEPFAAISAFYVIEHVERDHHAEVFARLHRWLVPGGYLLFTIEPEDQPGTVGEWLGRPMYFSQHDADTTLRLLRDAGFDVVDTAIEDQREGDREVTYMWVLAQRGESGA